MMRGDHSRDICNAEKQALANNDCYLAQEVAMKRLIAVAVVVLLVAGCATQDQQAQTEGTAIGALGGALLGAAIGGLASGNARGAAIGAGIGALTGGVAGFVYAHSIVKRREELAGKENDLDAQIKFAQGVNQDTEEYNRKLASDIKAYQSEVDRLVEQTKKQKTQNDELMAKKQELDKKFTTAKNDLASAEEQLQELKNFKSQQTKSSKELDVEIKKLEGNLAQLKSNTNALAALNARI